MVDELPTLLEPIRAHFAPGWPAVAEIGDGWVQLVAQLHADLTDVSHDYALFQCKSKYGTLRFDAVPAAVDLEHTDRFEQLLESARTSSESTCEACGAQARPVVIGGWVSTLCETHAHQLDSDGIAKDDLEQAGTEPARDCPTCGTPLETGHVDES